MKYLRLWRRFFRLALMRQTEYRANLALALVRSFSELALLVVTYVVFYRFADEVAGWTADEALLLLGVYWIFDGVWTALFTSGLTRLAALIQYGELDLVLLRPASSQFLVSCRLVNVYELLKVVTGVAVVVYAGGRAGVVWSPVAVSSALVVGACGLAVMYALRFCVVACTFWVIQISELYTLVSTFHSAARFPVQFFQRPVRDVLTYVIPVAFATTFPAQALLGEADPWLVPTGIALAAGALFVTNGFWRFALRHYTSAGG
ncbi:MAG TPA: ABC-2 family transporter protein [Chloroflexota bacterium]|nr:ABC-2 family transporter protein [Chloroflexota bacterium]